MSNFDDPAMNCDTSDWIIDSGSKSHMTYNLIYVKSIKVCMIQLTESVVVKNSKMFPDHFELVIDISTCTKAHKVSIFYNYLPVPREGTNCVFSDEVFKNEEFMGADEHIKIFK